HADLVTANFYGNSVSVLLGDGAGGFGAARNSDTGGYPTGVVLGDFTGDGKTDVAVTNYYSNGVGVLYGNGNGTFSTAVNSAAGTPVTVHYATANGTAAAGSDYTATSGDVTFAAGQTSKTVTVAVLGDRLAESTETFVVNLSAPTNAFIGDGQGVGTILDNEP